MRSSHSTLYRSIACGATIAALSLASSPAAHAASPVAKAQCPNLDVALTESNVDAIRGGILCLTNAERALHDLSPLRENAKLRKAALAHSSDMVRRSYFAHTAPSGATFVDRIVRAGYTQRNDGWSLGENLAWGTGELGTARAIHEAWMRSSGHRATILKPRLSRARHRHPPRRSKGRRRRRHVHERLRRETVITELKPWHRLDVCCRPALARTHITMTGVLDTEAVAAIDGAIRTAENSAHALTLDLTRISTVTPSALDDLLTRGGHRHF